MSRTSRRTAHEREKERAKSVGLTIREYRQFARQAGFSRSRLPRPPVDPAVARAAVNLRSAGMSKRDIHRTLGRFLATPPSHRELNEIYLSTGAGYRRGPGGRKGYQYSRSKDGRVTTGFVNSHYRERLAIQTNPSIYRGMRGRDRLNRAYTVSYLRQQGLEPQLTADPDAYEDWLAHAGEGTP